MTLHHVKHIPIGSNASPMSKNSGKIPTHITNKDDGYEVESCNISEMPSSMVPLLPIISRTCRCTSSWLPATLMTVRLSIKVRLLYQGGTTWLWHRLYLYINLEPSLWLHFGTPHRGWTPGQCKWGWLLCLCKWPLHAVIQASLTMRNGILNIVKIGKWGTPYFTVLPGSII